MKERDADRSGNAAPRIKGHWLGGSLGAFLRAPLEFYGECAEKHGDIAFGRFAHFPICVLSHPRYVEQFLVESAENLEQSRFLVTPLRPLLGQGLLIAGERPHARQKPLVEKAVRGAIASDWAEAVVDSAESLVASWKPGEPRDLYPEMLQVVSEVLARAAFGADRHAAETSAAVNRAVDLVTDRIQQFPPIPGFLPTRGNLEVRRALAESRRALSAALQRARAASGTKNGLLRALIEARGADGGQLADSEIREQMIMIHVAVRQNLAAALTWTLHLLSQNDPSYKKVAREAQSAVGSSRPGTREAERLIHCDRVVKESLRLYPPVWQVLRHAVRDTQVDRFKIRAGTQVLVSQWVLQRDARFFDEANRFLPERWEGPREGWKFSYFPFGAGPRACIGESLSFLTVKLVLAVLTRNFRLEPVPGPELEPFPGFALRPKGRVLLKAEAWAGDLSRDSRN